MRHWVLAALGIACLALLPPALHASGSCGDGAVGGTEQCDDGVSNGTTTCGCQFNCMYTPASVPCGDFSESTCDLHDVCDGNGSCDANFAPDDTACADAVFCNGAEKCQTGSCVSPGDPCAADICNETTDHCDSGALDFDGDHEIQALTDGLLLLRYLFGFRGAILVTGAYDSAHCTRCTANAIETYVAGRLSGP